MSETEVGDQTEPLGKFRLREFFSAISIKARGLAECNPTEIVILSQAASIYKS